MHELNLFSSIAFEERAGLRAVCRAVKRGGNWNNGANSGIFTANLNNAPTNTNNNIGFRCCNSFHIFLKQLLASIMPDFISLRRYEAVQGNYINSFPCWKAKYYIRNHAVSKMMQLLIESCMVSFLMLYGELRYNEKT